MKTITFTSTDKKMDLLQQVAKEMGIKTKPYKKLTDEEMAMPGPKVSKEQLEEWLSEDDGEFFTEEEVTNYIKRALAENRKSKTANGSSIQQKSY